MQRMLFLLLMVRLHVGHMVALCPCVSQLLGVNDHHVWCVIPIACARMVCRALMEEEILFNPAPLLEIKNNPPSQEECDKAFDSAQNIINDVVNIVAHYNGEHVRNDVVKEIQDMREDMKVNPHSYPELFCGTSIVVSKVTMLNYLSNVGF